VHSVTYSPHPIVAWVKLDCDKHGPFVHCTRCSGRETLMPPNRAYSMAYLDVRSRAFRAQHARCEVRR
jgi:hypothetical protein